MDGRWKIRCLSDRKNGCGGGLCFPNNRVESLSWRRATIRRCAAFSALGVEERHPTIASGAATAIRVGSRAIEIWL
jgi:hypothetical protein